MLAETLQAFKNKINTQQKSIEVNVNLPSDNTELLKEILLTLKDISIKLDTQHTITNYVVEETIKETIENKISNSKRDKDFIPEINISNIKSSKNENIKIETSDMNDILNKMNGLIK